MVEGRGGKVSENRDYQDLLSWDNDGFIMLLK